MESKWITQHIRTPNRRNKLDDVYSTFMEQETLQTPTHKMNPSLDPNTPPPPPPKPSSHEASRGGTPQTNQPLPHGQDWNPQGNGSQSPYSANMNYPTAQATLPKPPTAEEGWLPDTVKDKSYDGCLMRSCLAGFN